MVEPKVRMPIQYRRENGQTCSGVITKVYGDAVTMNIDLGAKGSWLDDIVSLNQAENEESALDRNWWKTKS